MKHLAIIALAGLLTSTPFAHAEESSMYLYNEQTNEVVNVDQNGDASLVIDEEELGELEQILTENQNSSFDEMMANAEYASGIGAGIRIGRRGIGGGIRIGPIGGGIRIGRDGIRVGGHAGRAGAGARVGRGGVRAGGRVGPIGAGGSVSRRGVRAGGYWRDGKWHRGHYHKRSGRFAGEWKPIVTIE